MSAAREPGERPDRLLRRLRATALVNAQLRSQLEGGPDGAPAGRPAVRRVGAAEPWVRDLLAGDGVGTTPELVEGPEGEVALVEGSLRRPVRAGLLAVALEGTFGVRRRARPGELEALEEGPPVEVLEAPAGPPFVVVAGRRHEVRGLPVTYPVSGEAVAGLGSGPEVRIGVSAGGGGPVGASVARRTAARVRRSVRKVGPVATLAAAVRTLRP